VTVHYLRDYYTNLNNLTSLVTYTRDSHQHQRNGPSSPTNHGQHVPVLLRGVILQRNFLANPAFITDYTRKGQGITTHDLWQERCIPEPQHLELQHPGRSNVNWNNFNRLFNWKDDFSKLIETTT
jgi:hypothetical protein